MKKKDKLGRLKHLLYNHHIHIMFFGDTKKQTLEIYEKYKNDKSLRNWNKTHYQIIKELIEVYTLAEELNMDDDELRALWYKQQSKSVKNKEVYKLKPKPEGRDNKDVHVGGGGSNRSKVRYPSKKRSLSTWKKFYKLFPRCAKEDGWDGKTSKRMK